MKYIANTLRVLVGLLFIFSGLIKSNDPTGFSYKLDEYFSVFSEDLEADQDSLLVSIETLDEVNHKKFPIIEHSPTFKISSQTSTWEPITVRNGMASTIFFADGKISLNNNDLFVTSFNAEDSNQLLLEAEVAYSVNGESLGSNKIAFTSLDSNLNLLQVDASQYVKESSWIVDFLQWMRGYALAFAIFICVFEIVLGIALLIGWAPKVSLWLLLSMIFFFTFLTWYSATYDKVTDCGCFGDAIKLTPWQSYYKDITLLISLIIILIGIKHIKPIFSNPFAVKLLTVSTLLSVGFSLYCWNYLPVKNYLKFKKGNDIEKLTVVPEDAPTDVYENVFVYAKDGVEEEFTLAQMSGRNLKEEGYEFVDRKDILISKGYEPEIHDFKIMDENRNDDYVEDFFAKDGFKLMIVMNEVEKSNTKSFNELKDIIKLCKEKGIEIYPLTASSSESVNAFKKEHGLDIEFYYGDKTNLKSIIRSNPGLVLFSDNVVDKTWPSTRLPSIKRFTKIIK
jgi:uncharacterized membrane protein YphA (DoxX/SURF4 family)